MREAPKLIAGSEIKAGQFVSMTAAGTVVPSLPLDFRPITVSPLVYVMYPRIRKSKGLRKHIRREKAARRGT